MGTEWDRSGQLLQWQTAPPALSEGEIPEINHENLIRKTYTRVWWPPTFEFYSVLLIAISLKMAAKVYVP